MKTIIKLFALGLLLTIGFSMSSQNYSWAKRWGTAGNTNAEGIEIIPDGFGSVYLLMRATGIQDLDYGPGVVNQGTIGVFTTFVMRYSESGVFKWGYALPGTSQYQVGVIPDAHGNFYLAGNYAGTVDFNVGPGTAILTSTSQSGYIVKYDSNMTFRWVKEFRILNQPTGYLQFNDITMGTDDKIYYSAYWQGQVDLNPGLVTNSVSTGGNSDMAVVKLDSAGNYMWHRNTFGGDFEETYDMSVDNANNKLVMVGGFALTTFIFGTNFTSAGGRDIFYTSLNTSDGSTHFVNKIGGTGMDYGYSCEVNYAGQILLYGRYETTVDFNPGPGVNNCTVNNLYDPFLARYNSAGNFVWVKPFVGFGYDWGQDIDIDGNNNIWLAGGTTYYMDADPGPGIVSIGTVTNGVNCATYIKLDSSANYISSFVLISGGLAGIAPFAINCSPIDNSIFTSGVFRGTIDFNPGPGVAMMTAACTNSTTYGDAFFARYFGCGAGPAQPSPITGNTLVCQTTVQTYTIPAVPGANSYSWSLPGGWTGTSTLTSITTTAGASSGNINVYAINACGLSVVRTLSVTVSPTPVQPAAIFGPTTICSGSNGNYSVAPVPGATSYTWTLPGGWSGISSTNTILATVGVSGGNILVTSSNACGTSAAQTLSVTVNTPPSVPGTISGNTLICSGSLNTYSIVNVVGATSYSWTKPAGWTGTSTTNIINTTASANSGNVLVYSINSCGMSAASILSVTVTTTPLTPGPISGNTSICAGSSNSYSVASVVGATSYNWILPGGWTGSSVTNIITTTASATSGNISVTASNACGTSAAQTLSVTVSPSIPGTPGVISGNISICSGSSNSYSVAPVGGTTTYNWILPGGWTGSSITNIINTTANATSGNVQVTASNACGTSAAQTLSVTVNTIPSTPGLISGNVNICSGTSNSYSIAPVAGATSYTWNLPAGWLGNSVTNVITTTASATSGNVLVIAGNSCGNSSAQTLSVTVNTIPVTPSSISGSINLCAGDPTSIYSVNPVVGASSYTWSLPAGWGGSSSTNIISATPGINGGNITVYASNACGNSPLQTLSVNVNPSPSVNVSGTPMSICPASNVTLSANGASSYSWSSGALTASTVVNPLATTIYTVTGTSAGCSSFTTITIGVFNSPTVSAVSNTNVICVGQSATLTANGAITYSWSGLGGGTSIVVSPTTTTSYTVTGTDGNNCGGTFILTQSVTICAGINNLSSNIQNSTFQIYPNPTNGILNIEFENINEGMHLQLYNVIGELLMDEQIGTQHPTISIQHLSNGIYFIRSGNSNKKIIKQ